MVAPAGTFTAGKRLHSSARCLTRAPIRGSFYAVLQRRVVEGIALEEIDRAARLGFKACVEHPLGIAERRAP